VRLAAFAGSGGGPIVDAQGRLIGIQGRFARGKSQARRVLAARHGIFASFSTAKVHQTVTITGGYLGVQFSGSEEKQAMVESVFPNSPGAKQD